MYVYKSNKTRPQVSAVNLFNIITQNSSHFRQYISYKIVNIKSLLFLELNICEYSLLK
jgi:hypothetical protein